MIVDFPDMQGSQLAASRLQALEREIAELSRRDQELDHQLAGTGLQASKLKPPPSKSSKRSVASMLLRSPNDVTKLQLASHNAVETALSSLRGSLGGREAWKGPNSPKRSPSRPRKEPVRRELDLTTEGKQDALSTKPSTASDAATILQEALVRNRVTSIALRLPPDYFGELSEAITGLRDECEATADAASLPRQAVILLRNKVKGFHRRCAGVLGLTEKLLGYLHARAAREAVVQRELLRVTSANVIRRHTLAKLAFRRAWSQTARESWDRLRRHALAGMSLLRAMSRRSHLEAGRAWCTWMENVQQQREQRRLLRKGAQYLRGDLLALSWSTWRECASERSAIACTLSLARAAFARLHHQALARGFAQWAYTSAEQARCLESLERTARAWRWRHGMTAFRTWCLVALKGSHSRHLVLSTILRLMHRHLAARLHAWRRAHRAALALRRGLARLHRAETVRAWYSWRDFVGACTARRDAMQRCVRHLMHRGLASCWAPWADAAVEGKRWRAAMRRCLARLVLCELSRGYVKWMTKSRALTRARRRAARALDCLLHQQRAHGLRRWREVAYDQRAMRRAWQTMVLAERTRAWRGWRAASEKQRETLVSMRRCVGSLMHRHQAHAFDAWAEAASESRTQKAGMERCLAHLTSSLLARGWVSWAEAAAASIASLEGMRRSLARFLSSRLARSWDAWAEAAAIQRAERAAMTRCLTRLLNSRLADGWDAWAHGVMVSRQRHARLRRFFSHLMNIRLAAGWSTWTEQAGALSTNREAMRRCLIRLIESRLSDGWEQWKQTVQAQTSALQHMRRALQSFLQRHLAPSWEQWTRTVQAQTIALQQMRRTLQTLFQQQLAMSWRCWAAYSSKRVHSLASVAQVARRWGAVSTVRALAVWRERMTMWKRACVYLRCTELLRAFRTMADEATEEMLRKMRLTRTERAFHALFASATSRASSRAFHTMVHYCHQRAAATTSLRHAAAFLRGDGLARAWHSLLEVRSIALNENMRRMRGLAYVLRRQLALAFARWRFDFQGHFRVAMLRRIAGRLVHWRIHRALDMWNSLAQQKLLLRSAALRFINLAAALALSRWSEVVRDWDAARSSLRACIVRYLHTEQVRAFLAWVCHASRTAETARMLRAAVAMFTRRDMVGAVRAWQSACRAAATLAHALSALMDRDLLCAWRSWSEWHERRAAVLRQVRKMMVKLTNSKAALALSRWYEAAEMQAAQTAAKEHFGRFMTHLMHRGMSRAWLQWSSSTSKRLHVRSALRRAVTRMTSFQLSRAWQAWDVLTVARLTALHKLRAAVAMFTRRDMVGAVRAWQSACRAAATLAHALSALMDRDLLCAWRSWSEWHERRAAALRRVRRTMMKLTNSKTAQALSRWYEAAEMQAAQTAAIDRLRRYLYRLMYIGMSRAWLQWSSSTWQRLHVRSALRRAVTRMTSFQLSRAWQAWVVRIAMQVNHKLRASFIMLALQKRGLALSWRTWEDFTYDRVTSQGQLRQSAKRIFYHQAWIGFCQWHAFCASRADQKVVILQLRRVMTLFLHRDLTRAWQSWSARIVNAMHVRAAGSCVIARMLNGELTRAWVSWAAAALIQSHALQAMRACVAMLMQRGLVLSFKHWHHKCQSSARLAKAIHRMLEGELVWAWHSWVDWHGLRALELQKARRTLLRLANNKAARALQRWCEAVEAKHSLNRTLETMACFIRSLMRHNIQRAWRSWSEWHEKRAAALRQVRRTMMKLTNSKAALALSRWYEAAEMQAAQTAAKERFGRFMTHLMHRGMSRAWLQWSSSTSKRFHASSTLRRAVARMLSFQLSRAWQAWDVLTVARLTALHKLRAAVAMFTRRDMVGAVRAWQSACRAAATLTHALSALMDRDLLCALRSWSEWHEKRAAALRRVRRTMMKLTNSKTAQALSRWYEAAVLGRGQAELTGRLIGVMHHLMHRGMSRAWLQWSSSTSKRFHASSALFFSSRRAVARMLSFQLSRAWQAWVVQAGSRLTALHKLRAAVAMFTRRDMVGAVRAWQSACRAAATLAHALSALMDRDLLCAWRSWSEWYERRAAALRQVRRTMMKLTGSKAALALRRWCAAAEMRAAQTAAKERFGRFITHLMHRGMSRAWLQWSSSTSKRFHASSALFFSSRRAVARMLSFQLSRAWQAWVVQAGSRLTALHKLRAAVAMFTRRDMVGAVRAWQSACRAAATLAHALSSMMCLQVSYAWRSWSEWHKRRTGALWRMRVAVMKLTGSKAALAFSRWCEAAVLGLRQAELTGRLIGVMHRLMHRSMSRAWTSWSSDSSKSAHTREIMSMTLYLLQQRNLKKGFRHWQQVMAAVGRQRRRLVANLFQSPVARALRAWRSTAAEGNEKLQKVRRGLVYLMSRELVGAFNLWVHRATAASVISNAVLFMLQQHGQHHVLGWAYRIWHSAATKSSYASWALGNACARMVRTEQLRAWLSWIDMAQARLEALRKLSRAVGVIVHREAALAFGGWSEWHKRRAGALWRMRVAVMKLTNSRAVLAFSRWCEAAEEAARSIEERAVLMWTCGGLGRAYRTWRSVATQRSDAIGVLRNACLRIMRGQQLRAWQSWVLLAHARLVVLEKARRAMETLTRRELVMCYRQWLAHHSARADALVRILLVVMKLVRDKSALAFRRWREGVRASMTAAARKAGTASQLSRVVRHIRNRGLARGWQTWHKHTAYVDDAHAVLARAFAHMRSVHLSRAWQTWLDKSAAQGAALLTLSVVLRRFMNFQLSRSWKRWCSASVEITSALDSLDRVLLRWMSFKVSRAWRRWCSMCLGITSALESLDGAVRHLLLWHKARALRSWQSWQQAATKAAFAIELLRQKEQLSRCRAWQQWQRVVAISRAQELKSVLLCRILRSLMQRDLSLAWNGWVQACTAAAYAEHVLFRAAQRLLRGGMARALSTWASVTDAQARMRTSIARLTQLEKVSALRHWARQVEAEFTALHKLRAAVVIFTRRDMVGAVRAWQSACRAAATLTHALSALMDRDLLCAWRSWSEWHERRAAFLATTERFGGRWGHRQVAHAWNTWHGEWAARLVALQRAISRMKNSKLARAWQTWLLLTRNLNPIRQAIGFMQNNQLARSWRRWMAMLAERKEATDRLSYAAKALLKRGLARALRSWQACLHQATRLRGIVTRWLQRSMLRGWIRWRQWYELRTETLGDLRRAVIRLHNDRKASALDSWRASIRERFQMRDMLALALVRWRHNEQWRAMDGWVDFVSTNLELVGLARLLGRKAGLRHGLNFLNFRSSSEWQLMRGLRGWKRSTLLRQLYDTQMEQLLSKHSVVRRWIYQKFLRRAWRTWCSHCTVEVEVQNVRSQQNAALADPPTASRPRAPLSLARAPSFVTNPSFVTKSAAVQQSLPQLQTGASAPARTAAAAGAIARARAQVGIPMEASTPPTVGIPKASTPPTVGIPKASTPPPQQQAVAEKVPAAKANAAAAKSKEGHALNEMADFAGARDAFDEAYRMCPRDGEFAKQSAICLFSAGNMALKANDILGAKARYDELLGLASLDGALRAKVLEKAAAVVEATAAAAKAAPASALRSAVPAPVRAPAGIPARAPVPAPAAAAAPSPGGELSGSENTWLRGAVNELVTGMGLREDRRSRMVAGSAEAALEVAAGAFAKAGKGAALTKTERALIDMGFDREKVVAAAAAADGDFQKAVNILFLEKASSTPRPSPNRGTQSSA